MVEIWPTSVSQCLTNGPEPVLGLERGVVTFVVSGFENIDYHGVVEAAACEVYEYDFLADGPGTLSGRSLNGVGWVGLGGLRLES